MPIKIKARINPEFSTAAQLRKNTITLEVEEETTLKELAERIAKQMDLPLSEDFGFYDSGDIDRAKIGFETVYDKNKRSAVYTLQDAFGVSETTIGDLLDMDLDKVYLLYDYSTMDTIEVFIGDDAWEREISRTIGTLRLTKETFYEIFSRIGANLLQEFNRDFEELYEIAAQEDPRRFFSLRLGEWLYDVLETYRNRKAVELGEKIEEFLMDISDSDLLFNVPGLYMSFPIFKLAYHKLKLGYDPLDVANSVIISTTYFKDPITDAHEKLEFAENILSKSNGVLTVIPVLRMMLEPTLFLPETPGLNWFTSNIFDISKNTTESKILLGVMYIVAGLVDILDDEIGIIDSIINAISSDEEEVENFDDYLNIEINLDTLDPENPLTNLLGKLLDGKRGIRTLKMFYTTLIESLYREATGAELNYFEEEIDDAITVLTDFMHQVIDYATIEQILEYITKTKQSETINTLKNIFANIGFRKNKI